MSSSRSTTAFHYPRAPSSSFARRVPLLRLHQAMGTTSRLLHNSPHMEAATATLHHNTPLLSQASNPSTASLRLPHPLTPNHLASRLISNPSSLTSTLQTYSLSSQPWARHHNPPTRRPTERPMRRQIRLCRLYSRTRNWRATCSSSINSKSRNSSSIPGLACPLRLPSICRRFWRGWVRVVGSRGGRIALGICERELWEG